MTGIFVSRVTVGMPRCARCKRPYTPRFQGDKYGKKCARIVARQIDVSALDHVSRTDAGGEPEKTGVIEVRNAKGEITAVLV